MKVRLVNGMLEVSAEDVYEGLALKRFDGPISIQHNLNDRNQWIGPARRIEEGGLCCPCRRPILNLSHVEGCETTTYRCECDRTIQVDFRHNAVSVLA